MHVWTRKKPVTESLGKLQWALRRAEVGKWLVKAVMLTFGGAETTVKTDNGLDRTVYIRSKRRLPCFITVMDVIARETRGGLLRELLYADDFELTVESEKELQYKCQMWKES